LLRGKKKQGHFKVSAGEGQLKVVETGKLEVLVNLSHEEGGEPRSKGQTSGKGAT
jgi:hypothetical protein